MSSRGSFLAELQRRHVYKVGAMYAVAGWLLVQVVTQVFPIYEISAHVQRILVGVIIAGFPVALGLAWLFDLTPEGIVRTRDVPEAPRADTPAASPGARRSLERRLNIVLGALLVIAAGYLVAERSVLRAHGGPETTPDGTDVSVAVLPFENLSEDKANGYFAEGIQDEILTRLAKIGSLRVTSRTSTQPFAARPGNLAEIAKTLGVAHVVEGSVQKSGNRVRINVQLIRAAKDTQLWAETYDRTLDDVFGVQGEVAAAIADALGTKLVGDLRAEVVTAATRNPKAYDAYLRGLALLERGFQNSDQAASVQALREAVAADPEFGVAWALLARAESNQFFFGDDNSPAQRERARAALANAQRIAPTFLETRKSEAYYLFRVEAQYEPALQQYEALHARQPNDPEILRVMAIIQARLDRWSEARRSTQQAIRLDPRNLQLRKLLLFVEYEQRSGEASEQALREALLQAPDDQELLIDDVVLNQMRGDLPAAAATLGNASLTPANKWFAQFMQAKLSRDYAGTIDFLERFQTTAGSSLDPFDVLYAQLALAQLQNLAGDHPAAAINGRAALVALETAARAQPDNPLIPMLAGMAHVELREEAAALAAVDRALQLRPESKDVLWGRMLLEYRARALARFGRADEAMPLIEHLLTVAYGNGIQNYPPLTPALLRLDPEFDALRQDPRFRQLVAERTTAAAAPETP